MIELFDTLLHLPEVLDRVDGNRRSAGEHTHRGVHGHAHLHGLGGGGGAPVDIVETPGEYTFLLDVPGFSKSDIQVTLEEDRVLAVKGGNGKRKREDVGGEEEDGDEEGCRYVRLERRAAAARSRSFARRFRLPEDADTAGVAARCENGVLTVTVRKQPPPEKKTKSVQVTASQS